MKKITRALATAVAAASLSLTTVPVAGAVTDGMTPPTDSIADSVVKIGVSGMNCTGVMISPSWALSASHCADLPLIGEVDVITPIQPGINRDQGTYSATVHRIADPSPDLVLLNINGVHDGTYAALPDRGVTVGDVGYGVGFGGSGENVEKAQAFDAVVKDVYPVTTLGYTSDTMTITPHNGKLMKGDSGGPLFIDDQVQGIFSHGSLDDGVFGESRYIAVASYLDWIESVTGIDTVGNDVAAANTPAPKSTSNWVPTRPSEGYSNPIVTDNGPTTGGIPSSSSAPIGSTANLFSTLSS